MRLGAGNHFDQVQVARRIEEVRAEKMLAELGGKAFGDLASGMPLVLVERMVPGLRCVSTFVEQRALDLQVLGDGFDDPVAVA